MAADLTPNYLCDADAMRRIHESAPEPRRLRFLVLLRDPIMRALSEWALFRYKWLGWEERDFGAAMAASARELERCNASLFGPHAPARLARLPTAELAAYLRACYRAGAAKQYVSTSTYSVCLVHALRLFRRDQFLVVRTEDLANSRAYELIRRIAAFTGLDASRFGRDEAGPGGGSRPPADRRMAEARSACTPSRKRVMAGTSHAPDASEQLAAATTSLEALFAPYNAHLAHLLGEHVSWRAADHRLTPLSPVERERAHNRTRARLAQHARRANRGVASDP